MPSAPSPLLRGLFAAACLALSAEAQTQFQTLPQGFDILPGNSGLTEPFRTTNHQVHHWVYDSSQFQAAQPIRIRSISLRPLANITSWGSATFLDLSLALSTSIPNYASGTYLRHFEDNTASLPELFHAGDLHIPAGSTPPGSVGPWVIGFSSPTGYVYDPGQGRDLILELRTPSRGGAPNPILFTIDAQTGATGVVGGGTYFHRTNPLSPFFSLSPTGETAPIVRIEYEAFSGLHADFDASSTRGFGPHTVQFTDRSFTTGPAGPLNYAWDFENDGQIDSNQASPSFTYTAPGSYTVRLLVRDPSGALDARVVPDAIVVHAPPTSNTSAAEVLEYHFDEVRGTQVYNAAATSLAPATGTVAAANWQADPQRTGFHGNEPGFGCLAASAAAPTSRVVDTNWPIELPRRWTLSWWQRRTGAHGPEEMRVFTLGGDARISTGGSQGTGMFFSRNFGGSLSSLSGADSPLGVWTHFALLVDDEAGTQEWRIDGQTRNTSAFVPGTFRVRDQATLKIGGGGPGTTVPFLRSYDIDDVRLYAHLVSFPARTPLAEFLAENAANTLYDHGCSNGGLVPTIDGNGAPTIGNGSYAILLRGAVAGSNATLILGFTTHVFGFFPLDLSSSFGPGCILSPFPDLSVGASAPLGSATVAVPIPNDLLLVGAHTYAQWLVLGRGVGLSPALDVGIR